MRAGSPDGGGSAAQGGVISPLILNIALHGMETAAGVRYFRRSRGGIETAPDSPVLVRYADDLLVFCRSREHAGQVRERLAGWLAPGGLAFNEAKTQIAHVSQGCRLPRIQRPPLPRPDTADQAQQGCRQAHPGTAAHRDACPARGQRSRGDAHACPRHPGVGGLLPDAGLQRGVLRAG